MEFRDSMLQVNDHALYELNKGELPIAAAVVLEGEIVAISSTKEIETKQKLVHAELNALKQADITLSSNNEKKNCILITNFEPCLMCLGAAMVFGVKKIVFSLESPIDGALFLLKQYDEKTQGFGYSKPAIHSGVEREETIALFRKYMTNYPNAIYTPWVKKVLNKLN